MGVLITFEGSEGVGKSTQITLLKEDLIQKGYKVSTLKFYEPGGTDFADTLRAIVKQKYDTDFVNTHLASVKDILTNFHLDPMTQALCFFAARSHQFKQKVKPELDAGNIIILDRSIDSTAVYQGHAQDSKLLPWIRQTNALCMENAGITIDKTLVLDVPVSVSRSRMSGEKRGKDFFDSQKDDFLEKLRSGYLAECDYYRQLPQTHLQYNRLVLIDAQPLPNIVQEAIRREVYMVLQKKGIKPNNL